MHRVTQTGGVNIYVIAITFGSKRSGERWAELVHYICQRIKHSY